MQEDNKNELEKVRAQHLRENEALEAKITVGAKERNNDKKDIAKLQ